MANKDISIKLNFDSNGQVVMGKLTVSAKDLQKDINQTNRRHHRNKMNRQRNRQNICHN